MLTVTMRYSREHKQIVYRGSKKSDRVCSPSTLQMDSLMESEWLND